MKAEDINTLKEMLREIVREEFDKREEKKQAACRHARSGTIDQVSGDLICDDCGKTLTEEDEDGSVDTPGQFLPESVRGRERL